MHICASGKAVHPTLEAAEAVGVLMELRHKQPFRAYQCELCGYYHTTRDRPGAEPPTREQLLRNAVEDNETVIVSDGPCGTTLHKYGDYWFLYNAETGDVTVESSPEVCEVLAAAASHNRTTFVKKLSNSKRILQMRGDGRVYTFVYHKTGRKVDVIGIEFKEGAQHAKSDQQIGSQAT